MDGNSHLDSERDETLVDFPGNGRGSVGPAGLLLPFKMDWSLELHLAKREDAEGCLGL